MRAKSGSRTSSKGCHLRSADDIRIPTSSGGVISLRLVPTKNGNAWLLDIVFSQLRLLAPSSKKRKLALKHEVYNYRGASTGVTFRSSVERLCLPRLSSWSRYGESRRRNRKVNAAAAAASP